MLLTGWSAVGQAMKLIEMKRNQLFFFFLLSPCIGCRISCFKSCLSVGRGRGCEIWLYDQLLILLWYHTWQLWNFAKMCLRGKTREGDWNVLLACVWWNLGIQRKSTFPSWRLPSSLPPQWKPETYHKHMKFKSLSKNILNIKSGICKAFILLPIYL